MQPPMDFFVCRISYLLGVLEQTSHGYQGSSVSFIYINEVSAYSVAIMQAEGSIVSLGQKMLRVLFIRTVNCEHSSFH